MDALKNIMRRFVYESPGLVAQQRGQRRVVQTLFEVFCDSAKKPDLRGLLPAHLQAKAKENDGDEHKNR